ncbi:MAG: multiprotein bridging factor aMBF1 [Candidatus Hodarchaeales archaeon]
MPECEICGAVGGVRKVVIEGATVQACRRCQTYGKEVQRPERSPPPGTFRQDSRNVSAANRGMQRPMSRRPSRPQKRERVLIEDYGSAIAQARTKVGLSRRELGMQIKERESLLVRIEHQKLTPSDAVIEKLERALEIELFTESKEDSSGVEYLSAKSDATTLGLVAKIKRKQKK